MSLAKGPGMPFSLHRSSARAGSLLLEETGDSDVLSLGGGVDGLASSSERRRCASLKEAALGSAPFILPTVPVRVGQAWTFDRVTDDTPSLPVLALQAHLLPYYEEFVRLLERARPGATRAGRRRARPCKRRGTSSS